MKFLMKKMISIDIKIESKFLINVKNQN